MSGKASHYFGRGNTARGAQLLLPSAFKQLQSICLLEGDDGARKSSVLRLMADSLQQLGFSMECFHSPLRPDELEGLIITDMNTGFADGSVFDASLFDGGNVVQINIEQSDPAEEGGVHANDQLESLRSRQKEALNKAYESFAAALRIHDEWENYYISSMDFEKADGVAKEIITRLFQDRPANKQAKVRRLFFGAATPQGAVDHIPGLTEDLSCRIFIKGRPGSGKSTMLKKIAAASEQYGYDVDIFHCGLDPNSVDMLIFPELSTAIFDSTAPHEYVPEREGDEILDMYERAMTPGTDEQYAAELDLIKTRYSAQMKVGTSYLATARLLDDRIRALFPETSDPMVVGQLLAQLQSAAIGQNE